MFSYALIFIGGAFVLFFVVAPLIVRFAVRMPARPEIKPVAPEALPSDALVFFNQNKMELERDGFVFLADGAIKGFIARMTMYIRLMVNRSTVETVMFCYSETGSGRNKRIHKYTEFCTEFSSGKEVNTNNSSTNSAVIPIPDKRIIQFPRILNMHELYQIHTRETDNFDRFSKKVLPPEGTEFEYLTSSMSRDLEKQARMGCLSYDSLANVYHPTFKGAFLMTWKSILVGKKK